VKNIFVFDGLDISLPEIENTMFCLVVEVDESDNFHSEVVQRLSRAGFAASELDRLVLRHFLDILIHCIL